MLGIDGTVTGHRIAPVRSSSAVLVSSQNQNRDWLYSSSRRFLRKVTPDRPSTPTCPHGARQGDEGCTDCHVSRAGDNNAIMAQLLLQGTNFVNFLWTVHLRRRGHEGFEAVCSHGA